MYLLIQPSSKHFINGSFGAGLVFGAKRRSTDSLEKIKDHPFLGK